MSNCYQLCGGDCWRNHIELLAHNWAWATESIPALDAECANCDPKAEG